MSSNGVQDLINKDESLKFLMRFRKEPYMLQRDSVYFHQKRVQWLLNLLIDAPLDCDKPKGPLEKVFGFCYSLDFYNYLNERGIYDFKSIDLFEAQRKWFYSDQREGFNCYYALEFAGLHDMIEGFTKYGDIPTPDKNNMTSQEKKEMINEELEKIQEITDFVSSSSNFDLESMLMDTLFKETLESRVISYLDKFDGFMSCVNELKHGNNTFCMPYARYCDELLKFKKGKFENLASLFETDHFLFDVENLIIMNSNSFLQAYEFWKLADLRAKIMES